MGWLEAAFLKGAKEGKGVQSDQDHCWLLYGEVFLGGKWMNEDETSCYR
jgi:hypothetical protein